MTTNSLQPLMRVQESLAAAADGQGAARRISSAGQPAAVRLVLRVLSAIEHGALLLKAPDGASLLYGDGSTPVALELKNWNLCSAVLRSGDIGMAESFIAGDWKTDNLPALVALFIRNRKQIEALVYGSWWGSLLYRVKHLLNRNSRAGSKKNIHAHYDLGNAFYKLWLDPSMTYSSALFQVPGDRDLQRGQSAKYRRIMNQLQLAPGDRVLEIGCGWGGFAQVAAGERAAYVTGLTLSSEQLDYARQRIQACGLEESVDLHLCDYRDCAGQYDAIASIEMFEAVGEAYWDSFFACLANNLRPSGRACIQSIVIADELFERYRKGSDFIQQYIFPGGMLPSPAVFKQYAARHGLKVVDEFKFGLDYAETLLQWRHDFLRQRVAIEAQGFDARFLLTWEFYLAYCEAAFRAGSTDVIQFTLVKT